MENKIVITEILSLRKIKKEVFRDVVYEWEDCISKEANCPIKELNYCFDDKLSVNNVFGKLWGKLNRLKKIRGVNHQKKISIAFITLLSDVKYYKNKNCIPIFIDIWPMDIHQVGKILSKDTLFFVTSLDIYNLIKKEYPYFNVRYIPLSVSNIWDRDVPEKEKTIDIIQTGRKNQILHDYALNYCKKYPNIEYVYSSVNGTEGNLIYESTKRGIIGRADTREAYMEMVRKAKIFILSSPGIDNSRRRAVGIDYPTPRFYESVACRCLVLGRYTLNDEFVMQGVPTICKNIDSFSEFEEEVNQILHNEKTFDLKYQKYLSMHLTTKWFSDFLNIING